jgi:hypothetical protein
MVQDPLLECKFFVPICRDANLSDGNQHEDRFWEWLVFVIFHKFDGVTISPGTTYGFYRDPDTGEQVGDESHEFTVALPESRIDDLRKLLSAACVVFRQKSIYLSVAGKVEFIEAPHHDSS